MKICLYEIQEPVLLVCWPGGVEYFNQVGGYECIQRALVGFAVPLTMSTAVGGADLIDRLERVWPASGQLTEGHVQQLESVLHAVPLLKTVRINQSRLSETVWGWLEVTIPSFELIDEQSAELVGVITWPN